MIPSKRLEYSAIVDRPPLKLPGGARVVVWPVINVEVWDIHRPMPRQMPQTRLELTHMAVIVNRSHAFGKKNQRRAFIQRLLHRAQGIGSGRDLLSIDQNAVKHFKSEISPRRSTKPVILGCHRSRFQPQRGRQRCPNHWRVQIARMIGKIDALGDRSVGERRFDAVPSGLGAR